MKQQEARMEQFLFWNARGIQDKPGVLFLATERKCSVVGITESHLCGQDLSQGHMKWISGPEVPPEARHEVGHWCLGQFANISWG